MIFRQLELNLEVTDDEFDSIYPADVRTIALRHFTPVQVALTAANFLAVNSTTRVLDVGSGAGKFCMVGASSTKAIFHGVEQRSWMSDLARKLVFHHAVKNVNFFSKNVLQFPVKDYSSIYFFNSFHENIDATSRIDQKVTLSSDNYDLYNRYLQLQLSETKIKTRLATYWVNEKFIPKCFEPVDGFYDGNLVLWEKRW